MERFLKHLIVVVPMLIGFAPNVHGLDQIRMGSKIDTESVLLGNIIRVALEAKNVFVEDHIGLGPTEVLRTELLENNIDAYPEYTGNGALFFSQSRDVDWSNGASAYQAVSKLDLEQNDLIWTSPAKLNNVWCLAIRSDIVASEKIRTIDQFAHLVRQGGITLAVTREFKENPLALPTYEIAYSFHLDASRLIVFDGDSRVTMQAASTKLKGANAAMSYGTDVESAFGLVRLEDNRRVENVFQPSIVIRAAVVNQFKAKNINLVAIIDRAMGALSAERIKSMKSEVLDNGKSPSDVARAFYNGYVEK